MERIVEIFLELAQIEAISKQEKPVAEYIRQFLATLSIECYEDDAGKIVGGNTGNIISCINGLVGSELIAFTAHMDTVKSTAALKPVVQNGRIQSDGSTILGADNRAGIAIVLFTIEKLLKEKIAHRTFEVIFTIGEETGLFGSENLDLSEVSSKAVFTMDSSASPGCYVVSSPTAHEFEIEIIGKPSHAAVNPAAGINALKMAAEFITKTKLGQVDTETTLNIGTVCGGEATNIIPPSASITGEVRSFDSQCIDLYLSKMKATLQDICSAHGGSFNFKAHKVFDGFQLNENCEAIRMLDKALIANNLKPQGLKYHGASDANMLNNRGLTTINVGIGAKNPHSVPEYIDIKDLDVMSAVMLQLLTQ